LLYDGVRLWALVESACTGNTDPGAYQPVPSQELGVVQEELSGTRRRGPVPRIDSHQGTQDKRGVGHRPCVRPTRALVVRDRPHSSSPGQPAIGLDADTPP